MLQRLKVIYGCVLFVFACGWFTQAIAQQESAALAGHSEMHSHHTKNQLSLGAAYDAQHRLWIVGLNEHAQLFIQHTQKSLQDWSTPVILDTGTDAISADGENHPKIVFGPHQWVIIAYTQPLDKPYTGNIRMLRSEDGGATFSPPFTVHDDRQIITHRFESVAFDAQGDLYTVWIDKRDQPPKDSGEDYAGAAIYKKISHDGGATFDPDQKVADHSCECCRIAMAQNSQGHLFAMWRHVFGTQTRDHAFASLDAPPNEIVRSTFDEWDIKACPHHGPGLAWAPKTDTMPKGFHAVWFGIRQDVAAVRYVRLDEQGHPIQSAYKVVPDPNAEHAEIMAYQNHVVIVWRSYDGEQTSLKTWVSFDGGKHFHLKTIDHFAGQNDHPRVAQIKNQMTVIWRTAEKVNVYAI